MVTRSGTCPRHPLTVLALAGTVLGGAAALAQDAGGQRLTFGVRQGAQIETNRGLDPDGEDPSTQSTTGLDLGYLSQTRGQSLQFGVSGGLLVANRPDSEDDRDLSFTDPFYTASYERTGPGSRLGLDASLRRVDVADIRDDLSRILIIDEETLLETPAFVDPDGNLADPDEFSGTGTREDLSLDAVLAIRQDTPLSFTFRAGLSRIRYEDTDSPTLYDSDRFRFGAGGEAALTEAHTLAFDLGRVHIDTDDPDMADSRSVGDLTLSVARPFGSRRIGVGVTSGDERSTTRLTGGFEVLRTRYQVSADLGVAVSDDGQAQAIGSFSGDRSLAAGTLTASGQRSFFAGEEDETVVTALNAAFARPVGPLTNATLDAGYVRSTDLGPDETTEQITLGLSLSQELTRNWSLDGGVETLLRSNANDESARSTRIFLGIGRSFDYRF